MSQNIYSIYIDASAQKIWDAITSSDYNTKYGYAGPVKYELEAGGSYTAYASEAMKALDMPDIVVNGTVLEVDPPKRLVQNWDPVWLDEPPVVLTWEIIEFPDGPSRLTLTQDSTGAPETERQTAGGDDPGTGGGGWPWVLASMKTLLETGKPMTGIL